MAAGSGVVPPPLGAGLCTVKVEEDSPGNQESSGSGDWQNPETSRKQFRQLRYQEVAGPEEALSRLWELCRRWLRPELLSKEQIMELLVLEQFLTILPQELQAYVRDHSPESGEEAAALARTLQRALDRASPQGFMTFKDVAESLTWEEWEQLAAARKGFCEESTKDAGSTVVPGLETRTVNTDVILKQEILRRQSHRHGYKKYPREWSQHLPNVVTPLRTGKKSCQKLLYCCSSRVLKSKDALPSRFSSVCPERKGTLKTMSLRTVAVLSLVSTSRQQKDWAPTVSVGMTTNKVSM